MLRLSKPIIGTAKPSQAIRFRTRTSKVPVTDPGRHNPYLRKLQEARAQPIVVKKPEIDTSALWHNPSQWLSQKCTAEQILNFTQQRRTLLGKDFKHNKAEFEALLTTSDYTGLTKDHIRIQYYQGDKALQRLLGAPKAIKNARDFEAHVYNPVTIRRDYDSHEKRKIFDHRDVRHLNRAAAYELPKLALYRQEFQPPNPVEKPLKFKFISMMARPQDAHNRKVVLTCKVENLKLSAESSHKLKLLAGVRYDRRTDELKMSCTNHEEPAQNVRYLVQIFDNLLAEAKDLSKDSFSDIPLDDRHIRAKESKQKKRLCDFVFPEEWKRPQDAPVQMECEFVPKRLLELIH
ncbi:hypothetical protein BABINDRAFT_161082 [Babjeviella inositovora NRRL Y-12698]|uniref:Small ribosomal subunit protein mS35 mitochondrial conserved domain-containing protein n=1 Tax=Babjeviella inositovora NRRL Y-12698 TaxID=984486 RepID=A0A1E3QQX5_9ASCO|nr:uncharacterized protein BABINDRAFT_161082 [Babjeviella inositovora NRRL Y-12698]ODQ80089.1 hypothetical protein BABINDRAFT_161082 [Babjeviella inositovora NRRL Y-12698]